MFESGRPVLLLPEGTSWELSTSFDTIVVAWDHSRPATRAVADALPLLQAAKRVHVVTVVDEKRLVKPRSGVELSKHLARHGVEVAFEEVHAKGRRIGDTFEAYCVERKADLLVMGAYGHSRVREFDGGRRDRQRPHPPLRLDAGLALIVRSDVETGALPGSHSGRAPENVVQMSGPVGHPMGIAEKREYWSSRTGFVLATIGSAIGLGEHLEVSL